MSITVTGTIQRSDMGAGTGQWLQTMVLPTKSTKELLRLLKPGQKVKVKAGEKMS